MCFYYDGICEVYREDHPVARKQHRCSECKLQIMKGEKYLRVFTVFERSAETFKLCDGCILYRDYIHEREIEDGCRGSESWPPLGDLQETLSEGIFHRRWDENGIHETEKVKI